MAKKVKPKPIADPAWSKQPLVAEANKENGGNKLLSVRNLCILLAVISLAVYANTLRNGFVYDDVSVITENKIVTKGISAIPKIFATNYRHGFYTVVSNDLYRPLSLVTFATEYQFFGGNPAPYHFTNIFLFACCVILLFLFLDNFFEQKKTSVAFIASLLFALHPIHTEVVANVKSRDELLCFFFLFLCLNLFIKYIRSGKTIQLLSGSFCFLLALFSKETAITFLAVIPFIFFFYRNENIKRSSYITPAVALPAIFFLFARSYVLSVNNANQGSDIFFIDNFLVGAPSAAARLATEIGILGLYLKLLFIPYPLVCDYSCYSMPFLGFDNLGVLISLVTYCALIVIAVRGLLKKSKDPFVFPIVFFLITISLFSNIPFLIGTAMGERLLFFPSVGFCLIVALLIEKYLAGRETAQWQLIKQPKVLALLIPVALIYSFITINRNSDWLDDFTLFSTDLTKVPTNCRLNHNMGIVLKVRYLEEKDPVKKKEISEQELKYFLKALDIYPEYDKSNLEAGLIYFNQNNFKDAIKYFKVANAQNPKNADPYNIGACYLQLGLMDSAFLYFYKTLKLDPENISVQLDAQRGIGKAFLIKNKYDSAEAYFKKVINLRPDNADVLVELGIVYFDQQKYPQAIEQYKKAIAADPKNISAYSNLGRTYFNTQRYTDAIEIFKKEIALNPQSAEDISFVAYSWKQLGKSDSAKKYESIAQKNIPTFKL